MIELMGDNVNLPWCDNWEAVEAWPSWWTSGLTDWRLFSCLKYDILWRSQQLRRWDGITAECGGNGNDARSGKVGWRSDDGGEREEAAQWDNLPWWSALLLGFEGEPPWTFPPGKSTLLAVLCALSSCNPSSSLIISTVCFANNTNYWCNDLMFFSSLIHHKMV